MANTTRRQRKTVSRVMHEFAHSELKNGHAGNAGKVKNRKQAFAIALSEAGTSKYKSGAQNRKAERRTEHKEALGETYRQEIEGRSHVDARGGRESSPAMGGKSATRQKVRRKISRRATLH
jgi:hypothetical protein